MSLAEPLPGRELAAFVTAVETGTVQGAADALDMTQSAATKRIQSLERRLGRPLLERGALGVTPTAAGQLLYPLAREALAALQRAEASVQAPEARPLLRIHASRTVGETLLPEWLALFRVAASPHRVSVAITNSDRVLHAVRHGECEVGFVEGLDATPAELRELVVAQDDLRVIVAPHHRWAPRRQVPAVELDQEPFLAREQGSGTRAVAMSALAAAGVQLEPALEFSSAEGIKRALAAGGFALLSERAVTNEITAGTLRAIPVAGVELHRMLRAVSRARPALNGPAAEFWSWLERHKERQ